MFKGDITLCGTISRTAEVKKNSKNEEFISFYVKTHIKGRDGETGEVEFNVSADGTKQSASVFTTGRKVSIKGTLYIRKKGDKVFYNLRSDAEPALISSAEEDAIEGTASFSGKIGKDHTDKNNKPRPAVRIRKDKKGNEFISFSAFISDKDDAAQGEEGKREFTWFNFLLFHPTDEQKAVIKPETYVDVEGKFQFGMYKGKESRDIIIDSVKAHNFDDNNA